MRESLLDILADPVGRGPLTLVQAARDEQGEIVEGAVATTGGARYAIRNYIPRLVAGDDVGQRQVEDSFGFKWEQEQTYQSAGMVERTRQWLVTRYGFDSADEMCRYLSGQSTVLDAGCGGGWSSSLWLGPSWSGRLWVGLDISRAVDVARSRLGRFANTAFVQGDVMHVPFKPGTFDVVIAEGVLHHTPSTERAFASLVPLLRPGGEIMTYVYRRKSPVREFTDDHVRQAISTLEPQDAWNAVRGLTALGQALAGLKAEVELPAIPLLGIPAGRHDVQRLFYWHFAKAFWNDEYTFEENNHVNFDWYHPAYAHRHTEDEVRGWCAAAGLDVTHFDAQQSGFTVRARRS